MLFPLSADGDFSYVVVVKCLNRWFLATVSICRMESSVYFAYKDLCCCVLRIDSLSPFFLVQFSPVIQMPCTGQVKQYWFCLPSFLSSPLKTSLCYLDFWRDFVVLCALWDCLTEMESDGVNCLLVELTEKSRNVSSDDTSTTIMKTS